MKNYILVFYILRFLITFLGIFNLMQKNAEFFPRA